MLNYLLKITFFLIFFSTTAFSETLKEVKITGNKRISKGTILVLGDIKIGKKIDEIELNQTLKNLYQTNFFSDIKISLDNEILILNLKENPIIEKIEISGIKRKGLVEFIYDTIVLKDRMSYTEIQFKRDLDTITNILKTNGYYFASINTTKKTNSELNSIKLNIDINLGEKAKIKEIIFLGDKKIKDKRLLEVIASEEHKFWKFITNKVYLNKSLIDLDKRLLENYYKNNGFYKVEILNSFAELDKKGFFKLIFNIKAGEKYYFNDFNLTLPVDYNETDFSDVVKIFNKLKKEQYSLDNINLILDEIDLIASSKIYDFIKVEVEKNIINNNQLNYNFIVKDSDKFYVEKINILGNFNTIEEVLRNKLIVDEGDPYNELLFNKSINELKSLGIFKSVDSSVIDGSSANTKIVNISVEEKPTGEISLGAGYGTIGGMIGGGLTEKNFLGKGITLDTNLQISNDGVKGSLTYAKPNFNYSDNTLFTSIKSTTEDNLSAYGYEITTAGISVGTRFEQYKNFYFSPELDFTQEDLNTNSTASNNLKKQDGSYSDFYFNYNLLYDNRDSSFNPTRGSVFSFAQNLPLISSDDEISNTFSYTKYKSLNDSKSMIGKVSFYLQTVNSLGNNDVRISKRAHVPYSRLRGFERGKVGPVDGNDYIGGNYVSAINLSTNLPGILSTLENIDFSYFIDIANVWGVDYDNSIDDSSQIRSSTGIGLDYLSPIGPLSFSLSSPITKKSSDITETFRFNLGTTF